MLFLDYPMKFHFETLQVSPISSISEKEEAECKISPYLLLSITVASLNVRRNSEQEWISHLYKKGNLDGD